MRTIAGILMLAFPFVANAQPGMYAAPPPPPTAAPAVAPEPKVNLEVGLIAASPKGDWENAESGLAAETSPGFGLQLGFAVAPSISIFGGLRYVRVQFEDESQFGGNLKLSHRELQLGVRFTTPIAPSAKLYIQGDLHQSTMAASFEGESASQSGGGLGIRGGVIFMVDRKIGLGLGVGYSTADIEPDGDSGAEAFEDSWLTGDLSLGFWF